MSKSLGEALPEEIQRVQKIITEYRNPELKGAGEFAACLMDLDVAQAHAAMMSQDLPEMIRLYHKLKEWEA